VLLAGRIKRINNTFIKPAEDCVTKYIIPQFYHGEQVNNIKMEYAYHTT
jgi:hypothetical protein